ncbi:hypothetical protein GCM10027431_32050 [Lysobacter rhizosphaerae]
MNWESVGAIGQVLAAVGLIPTLIYLAIQVREQTRANRRASLDLLSTQWIEIVRTMSESPDFGVIYLHGLEDLGSLNPAERLRFGANLLRVFRYWDGIYFHYADGAMPPQHWSSVKRQMQDIVAYPGVQAWWQSRKHWYTEDFNSLISSMIKDAPKPSAYSTYAPLDASASDPMAP